MGEQIADMFAAVMQRCPRLAALPADDGPSWDALTAKWRTPR
jgi:hypothetical protein